MKNIPFQCVLHRVHIRTCIKSTIWSNNHRRRTLDFMYNDISVVCTMYASYFIVKSDTQDTSWILLLSCNQPLKGTWQYTTRCSTTLCALVSSWCTGSVRKCINIQNARLYAGRTHSNNQQIPEYGTDATTITTSRLQRIAERH